MFLSFFLSFFFSFFLHFRSCIVLTFFFPHSPKNITPPNWLIPRAGASFGYGGQLVSFSSPSSSSSSSSPPSVVTVSRVSGEEGLVKRCEELEEAIEEGGLGGYCEKKAGEATCER